jgi:hypothetical protein
LEEVANTYNLETSTTKKKAKTMVFKGKYCARSKIAIDEGIIE